MTTKITYEEYFRRCQRYHHTVVDATYFTGVKLFKLTNEKECHNDLHYRTGLNIDRRPFNPTGECSSGGMYFFDQFQLLLYTEYTSSSKHIREVKLCKDSLVWLEGGKSKTNRFILREREDWKDDPENYIEWNDIEQCKIAIHINHPFIEHVPQENRTTELCEIALEAYSRNKITLKVQGIDVGAIIHRIPYEYFTEGTVHSIQGITGLETTLKENEII